jgi:hypothetical protein
MRTVLVHTTCYLAELENVTDPERIHGFTSAQSQSAASTRCASHRGWRTSSVPPWSGPGWLPHIALGAETGRMAHCTPENEMDQLHHVKRGVQNSYEEFGFVPVRRRVKRQCRAIDMEMYSGLQLPQDKLRPRDQSDCVYTELEATTSPSCWIDSLYI